MIYLRMFISFFLIVLFLTTKLWASTTDGPYIVHVSDTPPGYTMVITGGGYNPRTVEVLIHYPGSEVKDRKHLPIRIAAMAKQYDGQPSPLPKTPPNSQTYSVKPLHITERSVFVPLTRHRSGKQFPPGVMVIVYLKDGDNISNPFAVNRAQGWWLLKNVSRPGELNRIYGFNLRGDPYVKNHVFMRPAAGGDSIELPQVKRHREDGISENYHIQFQLPVETVSGRYLVFAHSNSGGPYGLTETLPLTVTTEPTFPQRFFNATEHGVKGNSFTNDLPKLQKLIDKASLRGGGIVYLPAGQYRLNDTLQLRSNIILRGAGRENTILFYGGGKSNKKKGRWLISARYINFTGLEDLTARVSLPMTMAVSYYRNGKPTYNAHIRRCRFEGGEVSIHYAVNMEISHSIFDQAKLHITNIDHGWIHDNEFTLGRLRGNPFLIWASQYTTIEHNRVFGSNRGFVWQSHGNFGHYRNFIDANEVESTRLGRNAGETYLFEGAGFKWWGKPDSLKADGFIVADAHWKPGSFQNAFAVVTSGRGLGEYVRIASNTKNQVFLENAWPVMPKGDVSISVLQGVVENVLTNNREINTDNSMMFFGAGAMNNRILSYRSENGLGISIWSYAKAGKQILVPDYFNVFEGNVLEDQGSFWLTRRGDLKQITGIRNLNNIFRRNVITDPRRKAENQYHSVWSNTRNGMYRPVQSAFWIDIGRSYAKNQTLSPIWMDTLIEGNYINRADWGIELRKISGGTVLNRNTFFDVKLPVIDQGKGTWVRKNRFDDPVFEKNPPPWPTLHKRAMERAKAR